MTRKKATSMSSHPQTESPLEKVLTMAATVILERLLRPPPPMPLPREASYIVYNPMTREAVCACTTCAAHHGEAMAIQKERNDAAPQ